MGLTHLDQGRIGPCRPGWSGRISGGKLEAGLPEPVDRITALDLEIVERASLHVTTSLGELVDDELLSEAAAVLLWSTSNEIPVNQRCAAFGMRVICILPWQSLLIAHSQNKAVPSIPASEPARLRNLRRI